MVQERLVDLGFDPGPTDGVYGGLTIQAVWAFEKLVMQVPRRRRPVVSRRDVGPHAGSDQDPAPQADGRPRRPCRDLPTRAGDGRVPRRHAGARSPTSRPVSSARRHRVHALERLQPDRRRVLRDGHDRHRRAGQPARGAGRRRRVCGRSYTPPGVFQAYKMVEGRRQSALGGMYDPIYINQGIAIHGALDRAAAAGVARVHPGFAVPRGEAAVDHRHRRSGADLRRSGRPVEPVEGGDADAVRLPGPERDHDDHEHHHDHLDDHHDRRPGHHPGPHDHQTPRPPPRPRPRRRPRSHPPRPRPSPAAGHQRDDRRPCPARRRSGTLRCSGPQPASAGLRGRRGRRCGRRRSSRTRCRPSSTLAPTSPSRIAMRIASSRSPGELLPRSSPVRRRRRRPLAARRRALRVGRDVAHPGAREAVVQQRPRLRRSGRCPGRSAPARRRRSP